MNTAQLAGVLLHQPFEEKGRHVRDVAPNARVAVMLRITQREVVMVEVLLVFQTTGEDRDAVPS